MVHYAQGGMTFAQEVPWFERKIENSHEGSGFLNSLVGGRTDRLPVAVAADSYVMPADVVSGLGQGNSLAGARILNEALKIGPWGTDVTHSHVASNNIPRPPRAEMDKRGGHAHHMPIIVAGGEFIVPPDAVKRIGMGDMAKGHRLLDAMVKRIRHHTVKTIKTLPDPKK